MNEQAGITTSHINSALGDPGETKKCTVPQFLCQGLHTEVDVYNAKTCADKSATLLAKSFFFSNMSEGHS